MNPGVGLRFCITKPRYSPTSSRRSGVPCAIRRTPAVIGFLPDHKYTRAVQVNESFGIPFAVHRLPFAVERSTGDLPSMDPLDRRDDILYRRLRQHSVPEIEDVAGAAGRAVEDRVDPPLQH